MTILVTSRSEQHTSMLEAQENDAPDPEETDMAPESEAPPSGPHAGHKGLVHSSGDSERIVTECSLGVDVPRGTSTVAAGWAGSCAIQ